jgi:hypothetical protein
MTLSNLAYAYQKAGRALEATALHEATLKRREARLGLPDLPADVFAWP